VGSAGGPIVQCPRCQQHNVPQAKFCQECGTPLAPPCGKCGAPLPRAATSCVTCGHPIAYSVAARFASPDGYTPKHLADRILTSKSALEGERKQVTVLFADMKGSMELLADRDPEQAREILDPVLELMMDAVHRYEGTVNQVMGDGIMALFGAPVAHEDHTVRGCYAALLMQESVKRYAAASGHEELQIRIGLNSGDVVVRSIGSDLRMDYSALGQTTHLAARMEQLAAPGSILIPAGALRLAEGYVAVKRLDSVHVKGMIQPVEVCEITGAGTVRTRFQLSAARGLTRFVGRAAELQELHRALQQAREGHGQVCAVTGQPGLGKSRLFHEFIHSPAARGCLVLESVAASYGKARPYLPFINLVRDYFHIDDRDDARKIAEKITGRLLSTDPATLAGLPALLTLVDVSVQDPRWDALDPSQRRYETLDAVRRLLLWETRIQPVVIVIENLHWIDYESQALLDSLVESVPTARLLLLVNYRPEYHHAWGERDSYHQLRLDPLPPDGARDFLDALVGEDLELRPLKRLLIERTEGNPFFIEETVRALVETGLLIGTRGQYSLACDITSIDMAPTVQAVLAARIDRLSSTNKRLLQCAAVIGKDVPFALLRAISDESDDEIHGGLHALQTAEFLYEATLFPEVKYTFKHALTHEVAYGSLLHDRRRVLHLRIAEAIEALYPDRLTEHSEPLAHHAFRAESWGKAVTYLRESGAKALARSAHRESAAHLEQALLCLQHLPQTRERLEQAIDIRFDLRNALLPLAQFDRIHGYLREAESLARKLDDRRRLGWLLTYMCHYLWMTGRSTEARGFGQDAEGIAETLGDFRLTVVVSFYLALASFAGGGYRQAEQLLRNAIRSLPADLSRERCGLAGFPAVMSRSYLGLALGTVGEFDEGTALAQEGLRLAEEADHPYSVIVSGWGLGSVYTIRGHFADAARVFERARRVCQEWNHPVLLPLVGGPLGYVYTLSGRVAEGRALLREALDGMQSMRRGAYHSLLTLQLGEAAARACEFGEALEFAEQALALARERGERGYEAQALRLLGQIDAHRNPLDVDATSARYRLALAMADELGMKPLVARCHLGLGALLRRAGMVSESRAQLAKASDMFRAMTMSFWSEQTEAELQRLE
jgi:class 3 adenylate cyclase/tetratricopeptide (TPR) repeat protein